MNRKKILGCGCDQMESIDQVKSILYQHLVLEKRGGYSVAINAEKVMAYQENKALREVIDNAHFLIPDGAGAVIGYKWIYNQKIKKIDFPTLMLEFGNMHQLTVFLLGTTEEASCLAYENLKKKYPNIVFIGRMNGFYQDINVLKKTLATSKPQIVFVGMGSPKQEFLAYNLQQEFPEIFFVCCGGALNSFAGIVKRAPQFFVERNLEWFYRLCQQPSRIRRQRKLFFFLGALIRTKLRKGIQRSLNEI